MWILDIARSVTERKGGGGVSCNFHKYVASSVVEVRTHSTFIFHCIESTTVEYISEKAEAPSSETSTILDGRPPNSGLAFLYYPALSALSVLIVK
jgi:hypothetical protein